MAAAVQASLTHRWQTLSPHASAHTRQIRASSNLACIRAIRLPSRPLLQCSSLASPCKVLASSVSSSLAFNPLRREALIQPKKNVSKRGGVRAAAAAELEAKATPPAWEGAAVLPSFISIALGLIVWKAPKPAAISQQAWQLLAIVLSTITGLVLSPLPVGAWAFLGLTVTVLTKTLTFQAAFSAFTNDVIWLIVISFFFARGFVKTGLGDRVATYFVKWLGKSTLGLSYGLTVAEALIAPAMPSTTARAGGVFLPIIKSLSLAGGSKPEDGTQKKLGAYLIQNQFQVSLWILLFMDLMLHWSPSESFLSAPTPSCAPILRIDVLITDLWD